MDEAELAAVGSLPYVDQEYNEPGVKEAIDVMIQQECGRFAPRDYLAYLGPEPELKFESELLRNEYERVRKSMPSAPFDISRYEVKEPEGAARTSEEAWRARIKQAQAQLEHQDIRVMNLELLDKYGKAAWLEHCAELEKIRGELQRQLDALNEEIQSINANRQQEQMEAGMRLLDLESQRRILTSKDLELQLALVRLHKEVDLLRTQAKARGLA